MFVCTFVKPAHESDCNSDLELDTRFIFNIAAMQRITHNARTESFLVTKVNQDVYNMFVPLKPRQEDLHRDPQKVV